MITWFWFRYSLLVLAIGGAVLGLGFLMASCGSPAVSPPAEQSGPAGTVEAPRVVTFPVTVNGRQVWCVFGQSYDYPNASGLSCDFEHAEAR